MSVSPEPIETAPPTILIVDDDDILRTIMRAELEDEGFLVVEAVDGLEALEACRAGVPDLLVIDVVMPRMDGYELCKALRSLPESANAPILMATGLDDEASISKAYGVGATDFITKPLQWTILRQRVRYMLRSAQAFQELRRNQDYLVAAKEAAEAGSRAKSEFLSTMSHELRTPLNGVIGLASVMQSQAFGALSPKYVEFLQKILESSHQLLELIEDVLDLSSAAANELTLLPRPLEIAKLIAEVDAQARALAERASVTYASEVEPDLPVILADYDRLKRVLNNLISNAVKFTDKGGQAGLRARRDGDGDLCLEVRDTGIGMSRDKIGRALSPFGQADGSNTRQYEGAGVGLPLTHRLVKLHGASLEIESEEGKGTTVVVRFPQQRFVDLSSRGIAAIGAESRLSAGVVE